MAVKHESAFCDFSHYSLGLRKYNVEMVPRIDSAGNTMGEDLEIKLILRAIGVGSNNAPAMIEDLALLNQIKLKCQSDPAVQAAYDKMITVIALKSTG